MTITRASCARRPFLLLKSAWSARHSCVQTARLEHRRRWLPNARVDRCVAEMTRGIASAGVGSGVGRGTGQMTEKIDGSHRRGDAGMTMKRR